MQLGEAKFAGGEIGISETETFVVGVNGAEIIRPLGIEQIQFAHGPSADDLSDIARNDFARLRFAHLIADRNTSPGFD